MQKTIKARFRKGMIEPLEKLELDEGTEILVTVKEFPKEDRFERAAGGWKDIVDCEALLRDIGESRKITRPKIKL